MASRGATTEWVNWALEQLIAGRGSTVVVTEMTQRWVIIRRQAQRLTAQALQARNRGAVEGISRELRALVALGVGAGSDHRQFGQFGARS